MKTALGLTILALCLAAVILGPIIVLNLHH
jgi:hypothetical protein